MQPYLVTLAISTAIICMFWILLRKQREQSCIKGWVKSQDLDGRGKRVYRDPQLGVSCKPDVVERNRVIEYKSADIEKKARWVDMLQLALQMKLTGKPEGTLQYPRNNFSFKVDSREMRNAMTAAAAILKKMRWHLQAGIAPKATPTKRRCAVCVFAGECSYAIR